MEIFIPTDVAILRKQMVIPGRGLNSRDSTYVSFIFYKFFPEKICIIGPSLNVFIWLSGLRYTVYHIPQSSEIVLNVMQKYTGCLAVVQLTATALLQGTC